MLENVLTCNNQPTRKSTSPATAGKGDYKELEYGYGVLSTVCHGCTFHCGEV